MKNLLAGLKAPTKYGFLNAKISGIKASMLKKNDYETLNGFETANEIAEWLEKTYYKEYLNELSAFFEGTYLIESAAERRLSSLYEKILKYFPQENIEFADLMLERQEIKNLKMLISAKMQKASWDHVETLLFPIEDIKDYRRFYEQENMINAMREVKTGSEIMNYGLDKIWIGKELLARDLKKKSQQLYFIASIEIYYEKMLIHTSAQYKKSPAMQVMMRELDAKNLVLLLRFLKSGRQIDEYLQNVFAYGSIQKSRLKLSYKDKDSRETLLRKLGANPEDEIYKIEYDLKSRILKMKKEAIKNLLGFDRIAGFLLYAEAEADTLKMISRGKEMKIDKKTIGELIA